MELEEELNKIFEYFNSLSKEQLMAELDKLQPDGTGCCPVFCGGECQGMGWCYIAVDFRKGK